MAKGNFVFLVCGIIGTPLFFLSLVLFSFLYLGYNPVYQTISELGGVDSPVKIPANIAIFNLFGILIMLFSIGVFRSEELNIGAKISSIFFFVTGVMMFFTGIFPTDVAFQEPSATGRIHMLFSNYQFLVLASGLVLFACSVIPHPKLRILTPIIFILGLLTLYTAYHFFFSNPPPEYRGLVQRVAIGLPYLLVMSIAIALYTTEYKIKKPWKIWLLTFAVIGILIALGFLQQQITEKNELVASSTTKILRLGSFCKGEEACRTFCLNSRGLCTSYCEKNPSNPLCQSILPQTVSVMSNDTTNIEPQPYITEKETQRDAPPVLKNLGVSIEPWNKQTNRAGDLVFTKQLLYNDGNIVNEKVFIDFGDKGNTIEMWFFVPLGTKLYAPVDGKVSVSFFNHTNDWGINIAKPDSSWITSFEHVVNLSVKESDLVQAGEYVGEAAPRNTFNNELAMVELAVWKISSIPPKTVKYCPFLFLEERIKPSYEIKLKNIASEWESFIEKDVYEQEKWAAPGCLLYNITERNE